MNRPRIQTTWRTQPIALDRINKRKARRLYDEGEPIFMLKANAKNNKVFRKFTKFPGTIIPFDAIISSFIAIHCNKGAYNYPAYYVEDQNE